MLKKPAFAITVLALSACFLSYKFGSTPVALAKPRAPQEDSVAPTLPPSPGTWAINVLAPESARAIATKAAGGAGVQHVATCVSATVENFNAVPGNLTLQLLDGTVILQQWQLITPYSTGSFGGGGLVFSLCGLNLAGSVNTSMTLQFSVNGTNQTENVNLIGYDAQ